MQAKTDTFPTHPTLGATRHGGATTVGRLAVHVWREEPLLAGGGGLLLLLTLPSVAGIYLDPRIITGAPAWLKPAKFALSTGVYALTLAWVLTMIPEWRRTRRVVARVTAIVLGLEVALIDLQAWRGTTSHFNVSTPLDAAIFAIMGAAIFTQTLSTIAIVVALWRCTLADRAMAWALRLGMTLTIAGALTGGLMTQPTSSQIAEASAGRPLVRVGAHTVGAPDGGPGLVVTGWSTQHGDLRVPHFVGLHAMQALPLFALFIAAVARRRSEIFRTRLTITVAAIYGVVFASLLVQALRGMPVLGGW